MRCVLFLFSLAQETHASTMLARSPGGSIFSVIEASDVLVMLNDRSVSSPPASSTWWLTQKIEGRPDGLGALPCPRPGSGESPDGIPAASSSIPRFALAILEPEEGQKEHLQDVLAPDLDLVCEWACSQRRCVSRNAWSRCMCYIWQVS